MHVKWSQIYKLNRTSWERERVEEKWRDIVLSVLTFLQRTLLPLLHFFFFLLSVRTRCMHVGIYSREEKFYFLASMPTRTRRLLPSSQTHLQSSSCRRRIFSQDIPAFFDFSSCSDTNTQLKKRRFTFFSAAEHLFFFFFFFNTSNQIFCWFLLLFFSWCGQTAMEDFNREWASS